MPIVSVFRGPHRETRRIKQQPSQTGIEAASPVKREAAHNKRHTDRYAQAAREGLAIVVNQDPGGLPSNWMLHFLAIEACSTAIIWPFIWASSAAACLSPPTKNAAGQEMTTAAAVDH
jgi:hypothetical protein